MNIIHKQFPNPGYLIADVPADLMSVLKAEIDDITEKQFSGYLKYNDRLAGNITHEYELVTSQRPVYLFANQVAKEYVKNNRSFYQFDSEESIDKHDFRLASLWVNFQNKYEFNPLHHHAEDLSFVIWYKLPFTNEQEHNRESVKNSNVPVASCFQFYYNTVFGAMQPETIKADSSYEGKMLMFPSEVNHCVNPFYTSDEYRISVAGNLRL